MIGDGSRKEPSVDDNGKQKQGKNRGQMRQGSRLAPGIGWKCFEGISDTIEE